MSAKTSSIFTFSKRELYEKKQKSIQNVLEPNAERLKPKYFNGYLLQRDSAGFFILKPKPNSPTMIREDLPMSVGYAAALERDKL